jgi:DNA-binding PadR family transcriptional regulator
MSWKLTARDLNRSSATLLALTLVAEEPRHGYEIGKLIERRSGGAIAFQMASLYPLLYRLEGQGLIEGRWKDGDRRRRYYRITAAGKRVLAEQRAHWLEFLRGLDGVTSLGRIKS